MKFINLFKAFAKALKSLEQLKCYLIGTNTCDVEPKRTIKKYQYWSFEALLSLFLVLQELWCDGLQMSKIFQWFLLFFSIQGC